MPGTELPPADDRLESWKQIAAYLNHSERTVRRWEATEGLPVHRHLHEQRGSVYAFRSELEAWREQRSQRPASYQPAAPTPAPSRNRKGLWLVVVALLGASSLLLAFWVRPARSTDPLPVPITTYEGNELDPEFSPDGSQIAFTWNGSKRDNYDIYTRPLAQDRPVRLTTDPAEEFGPAWSPDGRSIAFLRLKAGNSIAVMSVPAYGGTARVLTEFFYDPHMFVKFRTRFLAWRPNSRQLIVAGRNSAKEAHALWIVEDDGSRRQLTTAPRTGVTMGDLSPAYAPDGRSLLFVRGNTRFTSELYQLDVNDDGSPKGDPKLVTRGMISANTPAWIGKDQIVFYRIFQTGLWTTSLADGRHTPLGYARWWAEMPAYSYRGNRLAYAAGGRAFHIWSLNLAAPDQQKRLIASTHVDGAPAISPNGSRLAFSSNRSGNMELWLSGLDGQNAVQVTALEGRSAGEPRWSPDGNWIAFESRKDGRSDVFIIRPDGSGVRQLTKDPQDDLSVSWSRDGAWVYFSSNRDGDWDVWKTHMETGREVRVTKSGALGVVESADSRYLYYVKPEPSSAFGFLWKMPVQGGREEPVLKEFQMGYRGFTLRNDLIYFIADDKRSGNVLFRLQLASGTVTRIKDMGKMFVGCPDITPDGSRIFYMLTEEKEYDLVSIENFR